MNAKYNLKKGLILAGLVALPFAGCDKDDDNAKKSSADATPQKHNIELVYGNNFETKWQNIALDTLYKYNADPIVDTIYLVPERTNQFSNFSTKAYEYIIPLLRERKNVNPDKIWGKGELQLNSEATLHYPTIPEFFRDTLKYTVTYTR